MFVVVVVVVVFVERENPWTEKEENKQQEMRENYEEGKLLPFFKKKNKMQGKRKKR